jgi:hypothetical protein
MAGFRAGHFFALISLANTDVRRWALAPIPAVYGFDSFAPQLSPFMASIANPETRRSRATLRRALKVSATVTLRPSATRVGGDGFQPHCVEKLGLEVVQKF